MLHRRQPPAPDPLVLVVHPPLQRPVPRHVPFDPDLQRPPVVHAHAAQLRVERLPRDEAVGGERRRVPEVEHEREVGEARGGEGFEDGAEEIYRPGEAARVSVRVQPEFELPELGALPERLGDCDHTLISAFKLVWSTIQ